MTSLAATIPDSYLVAVLPVVLVSVIGLITWLVRGQGRHDTQLNDQATHNRNQDAELADHEARLRLMERRRTR